MFKHDPAPSLDHAPRPTAQHPARSSRRAQRRLHWIVVALFCGFLAALPPSTLTASAAARDAATPPRLRTTHIRIYGYLRDTAPASDAQLKIYSKTHNTYSYATVTASTVFKQHGLVIHRASLISGMYVIVTCVRAGATLDALTVSVVVRHARKKAPKK